MHEATEREFIAGYAGEGAGVGADVYTTDGLVYISAADDHDAAHEVVLSCAQMDRLMWEWSRHRRHRPRMQDE